MISNSNYAWEILIYSAVVLLPVIEFETQLPLCITVSKQTFLLALKGLELKDLFTDLRFEISSFA